MKTWPLALLVAAGVACSGGGGGGDGPGGAGGEGGSGGGGAGGQGGGPSLIDLGGFDTGVGAHVLADGAAVVWGRTQALTGGGAGLSAVFKLNAAGAHDTGFGQGGFVTIAGSVGRHGVAVDGQGRILVAARGQAGDGVLRRFSPAGQPDGAFGASGEAAIGGEVIAIDAAGRALVAGPSDVARYTEAGVPDATFGVEGKAATPNAQPVELLVDGETIVEVSDSDFVLARFGADGKPDPSFGEGGKVAENGGDEVSGGAIAGGAIVVTGANARGQQLLHPIAYRYTAQGALDPAFGTGGFIAGEGAGRWVSPLAAGGRLLLLEAQPFVTSGRGFDAATGQVDPAVGDGGSITLSVFDLTSPRTEYLAWSGGPGGLIIAVGRQGNAAAETGDIAIARLSIAPK